MGYFKNTLRSLDRPLAENLMGRGAQSARKAKTEETTGSDAHGTGERLSKMHEMLKQVEHMVSQATPEERQEIRDRAAELF